MNSKTIIKGNGNLTFENVAITDYDGSAAMYRMKGGKGLQPKWYKGLASLHKSHLLKHDLRNSKLDDLIEVDEVRCISLQTL